MKPKGVVHGFKRVIGNNIDKYAHLIMKSHPLTIIILLCTFLTSCLIFTGCSGGGGAIGGGNCPDIRITPVNPVIANGQTNQFFTYMYVNGQPAKSPLSEGLLEWGSTDTTVATISNESLSFGLATSHSTGTTNIIAHLKPGCSGINWTFTVLTVQ